MTISKSEDSVLASQPSDRAARENPVKSPCGQFTPAYESATFSSPALDQFRGLLPDFNKRLSPERDLGLSPLSPSRLSTEPLPRLVSDSAPGLVSFSLSNPLKGLKIEKPEIPVGIVFEVKPDLLGRTLAGDKISSFTLGADLPMGHFESRMITLRPTEDEKKEATR